MKKKEKEMKMIPITYDNGLKGEIAQENLEECPKCGDKSVRGKEMFEGGGVACINRKECGYWFCY